MLSSPRVYVEVWTPHEDDSVLAVIVKVDDADDSSHFEADVRSDRLEVERVSANSLEELKAMLTARYGRVSNSNRSR